MSIQSQPQSIPQPLEETFWIVWRKGVSSLVTEYDTYMQATTAAKQLSEEFGDDFYVLQAISKTSKSSIHTVLLEGV